MLQLPDRAGTQPQLFANLFHAKAFVVSQPRKLREIGGKVVERRAKQEQGLRILGGGLGAAEARSPPS